MQFGKLHGIALIVLGLILMTAQVLISTHHAAENASTPQADIQVPRQTGLVELLPGILGFLAIGGGAFLFLQNRRHGANDDMQPAKTRSGLPM